MSNIADFVKTARPQLNLKDFVPLSQQMNNTMPFTSDSLLSDEDLSISEAGLHGEAVQFWTTMSALVGPTEKILATKAQEKLNVSRKKECTMVGIYMGKNPVWIGDVVLNMTHQVKDIRKFILTSRPDLANRKNWNKKLYKYLPEKQFANLNGVVDGYVGNGRCVIFRRQESIIKNQGGTNLTTLNITMTDKRQHLKMLVNPNIHTVNDVRRFIRTMQPELNIKDFSLHTKSFVEKGELKDTLKDINQTIDEAGLRAGAVWFTSLENSNRQTDPALKEKGQSDLCIDETDDMTQIQIFRSLLKSVVGSPEQVCSVLVNTRRHTVGDLMQFVRTIRPELSSRTFFLLKAVPSQELIDLNEIIGNIKTQKFYVQIKTN